MVYAVVINMDTTGTSIPSASAIAPSVSIQTPVSIATSRPSIEKEGLTNFVPTITQPTPTPSIPAPISGVEEADLSIDDNESLDSNCSMKKVCKSLVNKNILLVVTLLIK